ncbi:hypothetical protein [Klebsiella michiganensis]|uniref:VgrG-related protein n=1 Tax=Klebsiella michiganensis TaxID=1134687 RepID=UPI000A1CD9FA|nr:hypothetical protein [Klebsiella michiganensis]MBX4652839.1 hypothetical protein [Klebsiella michiganensis]MDL4402204.1 hypothetical protein [Klebsiella michiganensis]MDL4533265.1 hypothetical protein [Klebsiella michiganensis]
MSVLPKIVWPVPSNSRGSEFKNQDEILSHLGGESTGLYMIGRSGMWHGGIHITEATTPWCALSGKSPLEAIDFPVTFKGEQAIRCMADGEVVAYRICKDYLTLGWESGPLSFSGSFVLVKHFIQPGEKESSGLHFYTLYMHLAPYSAYEAEAENQWVIQDTLRAYSEMDWLTAKLTSDKTSPQIAGHMPKGARVEWDPADSNLNATGNNKRKYGLVTLKGLPEETSSTLTPGQRYWVVVDNNNIKPAPGAGPGWWRHLLPPAKEVMVFDKTVGLSSPFAIKAGDPIGHMGYYQAPKDGGYEARYQVHIECTSMDDNLEMFLTNPEQVGEKNPIWLKYVPGLALYKKDVATGTFTVDTRATTRAGILPLSQVQTEVDKSTKQEFWQLRPENAYVPKGQAEPQLLSQYDLAKLGFRTETAEPASFDYLDGKNQPTGFFRNLIDSLYQAAIDDTRTSHALVKHNYQRLLDKIDSGSDRYSPMEYWRAFHNPDYRDVIQKTIVKHPSDWYFKKGDAIWQPFLNALKKDAPEWKKYSEDFIDKMAWMQDVTSEKLGPSLWHMHPIMFLGFMKKSSGTWPLGKTSERYESGGRGPGVISSGKGDHGGVSYGMYQLSSKMRTVNKYISVSKYQDLFEGKEPATPEFNKVWKKIAIDHKEEFAKDQHLFIEKTHYQVQIDLLASKGLNFSHSRAAINDMIWSTSVQYGPTTGLISRALKGKDFETLTDAEVITIVQDYKINHVEDLFPSSPTWWDDLKTRALTEKKDLLKLNELNLELKDED